MSQGIVPYLDGALVLFEPKQLEPIENYTKTLFMTAYSRLPPPKFTQNNALQTLADIYEVGRNIYDYPANFTHNVLVQIAQDASGEAKKKVEWAVRDFFSFPHTSFSSTSSQYFKQAEQAFSLFSSVLNQTKEDLKKMFVDLFNAFIVPISLGACNIPVSLNFLNASAMTGTALFVHKLAIEHLKEHPDQAKSLTCGAIMGIWISFTMDQSLLVGMLSGSLVALITDTAIVALSKNAVMRFCKKQYIEWKIEKRTGAIYKFTKTIFPYIFYTLGTAFVYAKLRPLTDRLLQDNPPSSEQLYTLQLVATSAMLFSMGTSYLKALTKSLLKPIVIGLSSAEQTRRILFWTPRVLAILSITYIVSSRLKN